MGKGTNLIATFADLQSIGYRIPPIISNTKECVTYGDFSLMDTTTIPNGPSNKLLKWQDVPASNGLDYLSSNNFNYTQKVPMIIAFQSILNSESFGLLIGLTDYNGSGFRTSGMSPFYVAPSVTETLPEGSSLYISYIPNNLKLTDITPYQYFGIHIWNYPSDITSYIVRLDFINGDYFHYGPYGPLGNAGTRHGIVSVLTLSPSNGITDNSNYPYSGTFSWFGDYNDFINSVKKITFKRIQNNNF